jgi:fructose-1,6-bisphosphatase II
MDRNLALEVVRVTEAAALASARWMGRGDEVEADAAAVQAMYQLFPDIDFHGQIVIGEGERDATAMFYDGEGLGTGRGPDIEVALDALEGATSCATGAPNAISVIAIAEHGGFLRCPHHIYMEKLAVGPLGKGVVDLDKPLTENLSALAKAKGVPVETLVVVILDRPRHEGVVNELRQIGVRIKLISDGDLAAALATTREKSSIDILVGTGGAAQGILAAAAMRCLGGEIQGRFRPRNQDEVNRLRKMGITDLQKKYGAEEMARGNVVFAATAVTIGDYLRGVRFFHGTNSVVMRTKTGTVRLLETFHHFENYPEYKHDG